MLKSLCNLVWKGKQEYIILYVRTHIYHKNIECSTMYNGKKTNIHHCIVVCLTAKIPRTCSTCIPYFFEYKPPSNRIRIWESFLNRSRPRIESAGTIRKKITYYLLSTSHSLNLIHGFLFWQLMVNERLVPRPSVWCLIEGQLTQRKSKDRLLCDVIGIYNLHIWQLISMYERM